MKELSIEEKAKRYDEALERAKGVIEQNPLMEYLKKGIEYILPALKESEDERIRQFLIHEVTETSDKVMSYRNMNKKDVLAWLEKQSEHANFLSKIQVGDKVTRNEDGVLVNLSQLKRVAKPTEEYNITGIGSKHATGKLAEKIKKLELLKQSEQKPIFEMKTPEESLGIDSETYSKIVDECVYGEQKPIKEHNACEFCEDRYGCVSPCSMKLIEEEKPTDKIESRQEELTEFEKAVKQVMEETIECGDTHNLKADADMLLRLVRKPAAWSEEDERFLNVAINILNSSKVYTKSPDKYEDTINWLKSLKERYTWKPSDEQMDALHYVTNFDYGGHKAILVSLYEQLKKLKG